MKTIMENQIDEEQALARLLGVGSGSPVATPEMLMRMAQWLHATLKREIDARPARGKQEWGRVSDIMEIYGISRAQANCWMVRLRAEGKVRVQNPISGAQGVGDTFYNLADIARAYEENAKRFSRQ